MDSYWLVSMDDEDLTVIYDGPSMKDAVYAASHCRGIDGHNSYVVFYKNNKAAYYVDEDDFYPFENGVVAPYFK